MAEWTRVTGTLTAWNEENAPAEDLLAAVQEVLPTDVCPTWFNKDNIKVQNASERLFETGNHYWNFTLPIVKTSKVPGSESLSVHLVSYVRDNAVFLGTDVDSYVLDTHKPYDPAPDPKPDSWNTLHTSHCITYGEGFKSEEKNWLNTSLGQKLYTAVISFYNPHVSDSGSVYKSELYPPACISASNFSNIAFRPRYLAIAPGYKYSFYGSYTYRSVNTPNKVYTQTHGCFFLVGDAEDYAPQTESAQG
jgi:hypothetical protein